MKKIAVFNNKGGVAKTTSVINIAYNMNKKGLKVLIVDCDVTQRNSFNFFLGEKAQEVQKTKYENIDNSMEEAYEKLSETDLNHYDYILFDMPPTITDNVVSIIREADHVYVPMQIDKFSLDGLENVLSVCNNNLGGIIVTMYDEKISIMPQLLQTVKDTVGSKLMNTIIPFSNPVKSSQIFGMPLEEYFVENGVIKGGSAWKVVDAYAALTEEIIKREV